MITIIPIIILVIVFLLIALRKLSNTKLQIWQLIFLRIPVKKTFSLEIWHIMLFGAMAVLLTGQISPVSAVAAVNYDVLLFLFGMFVVGQALEESGYLSHLSHRIFKRAKSPDRLLLFILFGMGFASAVFMNDTLAIIGTPVVLLLAKKHSIAPKALLLALAFAVTLGSAMSPIGNPQNLLIALSGNVGNPFMTFLKYLLLPTIINLFAAYLIIKFFYKGQFSKKSMILQEEEPIKSEKLTFLSKTSVAIVLFLIVLKILMVFLGTGSDFRLTYIALFGALPIIVFYPRRFELLRKIDWKTLIFFASMFILMQSVWQTGFFQNFLSGPSVSLTSIILILLVGILLSQLISNVPLVALYLPILIQAGASSKEMVALAAGSTIAGNLLILGAASNVIIIQNAEKKGQEAFTFGEFAKVGIPLTLVNMFVYWLFLTIL